MERPIPDIRTGDVVEIKLVIAFYYCSYSHLLVDVWFVVK